jgi:hypothetical protein
VTWTFERAGQRLKLEVRQVPGTDAWEMSLRQPGGVVTTEQFGRRDMIQAYLASVQDTLRDQKWIVVTEDDHGRNLVAVDTRASRDKYARYGSIKSQLKVGEEEADAPADVYDLTNVQPDIPAEWKTAATYALEFPAKCPHCREPLNSLRVVRLKRSQVSFTSTLPRWGNVLACPLCERIISAELSGLI